MRIPSTLFGTEESVETAAAALVGRREHSASVLPPADVEPDGLVVLQRGSPLIADIDALRPYAVHARIEPNGPDADALFEDTLTETWGITAFLGQDTQGWLLAPERHVPFLEAACRHAGSLLSLDGRYTIGMTTGSPLWDLPTNLRYVLAQRGLDVDTLLEPLPPGGWPELAKTVL